MKNTMTRIAIIGAILASAVTAASAAQTRQHNNEAGYNDSTYGDGVTQEERRTRDMESSGS